MKGVLYAGAIGLFLSLFLTPLFIKLLVKRKYGQQIREDGPTAHQVKRGTPTMGGIVIITSVIVAYFSSHLLAGSDISSSALLVLAMVTGLALIGFLDDWLKIVKNRSLGLTAKQKILGQSLVAIGFAYAGIHFIDKYGLAPISRHLSGVRDTSLVLGGVLVIIWVALLIIGSSNAVNLTDGLDGLASGTAIMAFLAFVLIGIWEFRQSCEYTQVAKCYAVRDPLDMAVLAAAFAGACAGFLWWNTSPAKIFMGDVGSLGLGGAIAGFAITLRTELLLIPLGGLFIIITLSVIIQVLYFRATGGKRFFKMAPLQHHFELSGWGEVTIVVRFWIIAGICVASGLGLFYAQWVVR